MKVSELMKDVTLNPDYTGWVTNDDYVFAINITPDAASVEPGAYAVVQMGIAGLDAQRSFASPGDRYIGDEAQDYVLSHKLKYGTGNAVVTDYVYFNILTGKGEKGKCSIIVNSDGSGNAGESSAIDIEFKKIGDLPTEFTYTVAA